MRAANDIDFYLDGVKANITAGSSFYTDLNVSMACDNSHTQRGFVHFEYMAVCDSALNSIDTAKMLDYSTRIYGV